MARELPQAKWAPKYAHVGVYAAHQNLLDPLRLENVPNLVARIANKVSLVIDVDDWNLLQPGSFWISPVAGKSFRPLLMFDQIIVLAAIRLIDRIRDRFFAWDAVAPCRDILWKICSGRDSLSTCARRVRCVMRHTTAGSMNHHGTVGSQGSCERIYSRRDLLNTTDGVDAVVRVPNVANNERCGGGLPLSFRLDPMIPIWKVRNLSLARSLNR